MSPVDAAWLRMDRPTNPMTIVGVVVFDGRVNFSRFRRTVAERFLSFPRFRCCPHDDAFSPEWRNDDDFDIRHHVVRARLPAPGGQAELEALVSGLASTDLDRSRPMWQFHFIERFGAGSAAVLRIHHCYADGMAMIRVFLTLTDAGAEPRPRKAGRRARAPRDDDGAASSGPGIPGAKLLQQAWREGAAFLERAAMLAQDPDQAGEMARHALGIAGELTRVALLPDDPPTRFKGPLGSRKIAAWTDPLPLAEVKALARALGCTVNDILLSTAAGALGAYLRRHGENTDGLVIRAAVPVNLRDAGAEATLGNCFGLVFLELPLGIRDPLERLFEVHAAMAQLKGSYQPVLTLGLMAALGRLPAAVESAAVDLLSAKATAVATNVPGPRQPLYLAGGRIGRLIFWVPQSGEIGLGISILSYAGNVQFGLIADAERVPDPDEVTALFCTEFENVLLSTLLGPYLRGLRELAGGGSA
jgi:WS/DGAT/MGAT family acyltransferase